MVSSLTRKIQGPSGRLYEWLHDYSTNALILLNTESWGVSGYQETQSIGHPWPPGNRRFSGDVGGGFLSQKVEITGDFAPVFLNANFPGGRAAFGPICAYAYNLNRNSNVFITPSSNSALDALGTTGIARSLPTNPLAGMGQFLGELRELPKVPLLQAWKNTAALHKRLSKHPRGKAYYAAYSVGALGSFLKSPAARKLAADEYLNQVFGWVPFVSDVRKFAKTASNQARVLRKFDAGSGKITRSGTSLGETSNTTISNIGNSYGSPGYAGSLYLAPGKLTQTTTTSTKQWFKGAFTYYLPPVGSTGLALAQRVEQQANRLYGLRLDPELLWQLTPWSWAIDWVTNAGDVIHNFKAFQNDGLVMKYGYIMETKISKTVHSLEGVKTVSGTFSRTQTETSTTKIRRAATPYGFGKDPSSFSKKQLATIAALGFSKI